MKPKQKSGEPVLFRIGSPLCLRRCIVFLFGKKKAPEVVSPLRLPKSPHPLRGWTNFGLYEAHGTNPKTSRSNKKMVEALDEAGAVAAALTAGLAEPVSVSEIQRRMITDAQADCLRRMKVSFSGAESMEDASALICMVNDREDTGDRITPDQWAAACSAGVLVSALSCQRCYRSCMKGARS